MKRINRGNTFFMMLVGFLLFYLYIFPVLMCARLTASLIIDLRSFCFIEAPPLRRPPPPRVKCHNAGGGGGGAAPPPFFFLFFNPKKKKFFKK